MSILIVDDEQNVLTALHEFLAGEGYADIQCLQSGVEALDFLGLQSKPAKYVSVDLILLDIVLNDMDGKELCKRIKREPVYKFVPVIMLTGIDKMTSLGESFHCGAVDYIVKPPNNIDLLSRIQAHLRLKIEMDHRVQREFELLEEARELRSANILLSEISYVDGLTNIKNRRYFDEMYVREWRRAQRQSEFISLLMVDIDNFKSFNDSHGHQAGDTVLKRVAETLFASVHRSTDFVARYGGEEFVAVLPNTKSDGALVVAERMRQAIVALNISHATSSVAGILTVSIGVAATVPTTEDQLQQLVSHADEALYAAKDKGRNRVETLLLAEAA